MTRESTIVKKWMGLTLRLLVALAVLVGWGLGAVPAAAQGTNLCVGNGPNKIPNGDLEPGEQCDDGDLINENGCNNFCGFGTCVDDLTGRTNNCTANDVVISLVLNDKTFSCEEGEFVDLDPVALLQANASERYDLGIFTALDGGDARIGECFHTWLNPDLLPAAGGGTCSATSEICNSNSLEPNPNYEGCPGAGLCDDGVSSCNADFDCPPVAGAGTCLVSRAVCSSDTDCTGFGDFCVGVCTGGQTCDGGYDPVAIGECSLSLTPCFGDLDCPGGELDVCEGNFAGPFYNAEVDEDPVDTCGDIEQSVDTFLHYQETITVPCQDTDGDGKLDIGSCVSWDNQKAQSPSCTDIEQTLPNTKAKCRCETINVGNVFVAGKIIIEKVCDPDTPTQAFTFTSDFDFKDDDPPVGSEGPNPTLNCGESTESVALEPTEVSGTTYSVVEDEAPAGWFFSGVVCTGDDDRIISDEEAIDLLSGETVTCVFSNIKPEITVDKDTVAELTKVGDDVLYDIAVSYPSTNPDAPDLVCTISDSVVGDVTADALAAGCTEAPAPDTGKVLLTQGDTCSFSKTITVPDGVGTTFRNTATALCTIVGEADSLSDADFVDVDVFAPSITFEKTGDALSKIGDSTDYTITLNNTSSANTPDLTCTITDAAVGVDETVTLASGAGHTVNATAAIPVDASDPYVNTASVSCSPDGFPNVLDASDDHSVNLFQPSIGVSKEGDESSKVGDDVSYTFTLSNTSSADTPDLTCTATDSLLGLVFGPAVLPPGSTVVNRTYTVQAGDPDPLSNEVTVTCSLGEFPNVLEASATHSVELFQPAFSISKEGDESSKVGDDVSYTFTLSNISSADTPDLNCTATDSLLGVVFGPQVLPPGNTVVNRTYTVQVGDPDPLGNTVTLSCTLPADFTNRLEDVSDDHSVDLVHPSFTVAKSCTNEPVPQTGPALYDVTFDNTGDVNLSVTADDGIGTFTLVPGTPQTFQVSLPGPFAGVAAVSNTVNASATLAIPGTFTNVIQPQSASATCVVAGQIIIEKATEPPGDTTVFTYTATYSGGFALSDGESYNSGWLAPGIVYSVAETMPLPIPASGDWVLTDIDCSDESVGDPDTGIVDIALAAGESVTCTYTNKIADFTIDKGCVQEPVPIGSLVEFNINVKNTGYAALVVDITDLDLEIDPATASHPNGIDGDGDPHTRNGVNLGLVPGDGICREVTDFYADDGGKWNSDPSDGCFRLTAGIIATQNPVTNEVSATASIEGLQWTSGTRTDDASCEVEVGATRTIGFWKTHEDFTCHVVKTHLDLPINLGYTTLGLPPATLDDTCDQVFGVFYASNPWNDDGTRRERTCQANVQAGKQLLAAILNTGLFNAAPVPVLCGGPADPPDCLPLSSTLAALGLGGLDIISAAQMALGYCVDVNAAMCDRMAVIEFNGLLGDYNEHPEPEVAIVEEHAYPIQPADPSAARDRADESAADCAADLDKKAKGGRRRGDDITEVPPPVEEPVSISQIVPEPVVEETAAELEPVVEVTPEEPVIEEVVLEEALSEPIPAEAEVTVDAPSEPVAEIAEAEPVASDLPGSIGYVVPEATDDSVELVEESAATLTIENLTFLVSDDGLALSGLVKLSSAGDSTTSGIADLRLAVSYRGGDDQPWETVDESAACSFDSEFPLALEPSEAGADVAFECSLSRAVPAGAAVRVRAEALDYEGETAFQEVARGL